MCCGGRFPKGFREGGLSARCHHKPGLNGVLLSPGTINSLRDAWDSGVSWQDTAGEGMVAADRPPQLMMSFFSVLKSPLTRKDL